MQTDARLEEEADVRTSEVPRGDIEVRGLTFAYGDRPDAEVLRGVDATIRTGTAVAARSARAAPARALSWTCSSPSTDLATA